MLMFCDCLLLPGKHDDLGRAYNRGDARAHKEGELLGCCSFGQQWPEQHHELAGYLPGGRRAAAQHHPFEVRSQQKEKKSRLAQVLTQ